MKRTHLPLNGLRVLDAAARHLSFTRAADELAVTPAAVGQQIRALEQGPRGIYCGAIGWLAPDGDFSLNVAIRTLVMHGPQAGVYRVGGGIVHDSDPAMEWEECLWKARVLTS